jgi:choline kinase
MKDKTLVILAAGMGSRFGGLKQIFPVGPNGEFIMDYSIYSAIKYGFNKIVFVIREEHKPLFEESICKRIEGKVDYAFAFQKLDDIPKGFKVPEGREKPWGTAHAIYCARKEIKGNFAVITSDDFYGDEAFKDLSDSLNGEDYSIIGYKVGDTLSENGSVKRGIIKSKNGIVKQIIESSCVLDGDKVVCTPLDKKKRKFKVSKDNSCSMLMNGFTQELIKKIERVMKSEFEAHKDDLMSYEMLLPDIMDESIQEGVKIHDITTNSKWIGMTYKSDAEALSKYIKEEIKHKVYPKNLWK